MIISTCSRSLTELHHGSAKTRSPGLPRQKRAPRTLHVSGVSDHGQKGITSPGARNMISPVTIATRPIIPISH
jgi:hypothetical protein